jgi:hypothetical protein
VTNSNENKLHIAENKSMTNSIESELQRAEPNQLQKRLKTSCGEQILPSRHCIPNELMEKIQWNQQRAAGNLNAS